MARFVGIVLIMMIALMLVGFVLAHFGIVVILVLAVIRFAARGYFDTILTAQQTGAVFFILAFGMIVIWRAKMLMDFRRLTAGFETSAA